MLSIGRTMLYSSPLLDAGVSPVSHSPQITSTSNPERLYLIKEMKKELLRTVLLVQECLLLRLSSRCENSVNPKILSFVGRSNDFIENLHRNFSDVQNVQCSHSLQVPGPTRDQFWSFREASSIIL